jgi:hypothetical protein
MHCIRYSLYNTTKQGENKAKKLHVQCAISQNIVSELTRSKFSTAQSIEPLILYLACLPVGRVFARPAERYQSFGRVSCYFVLPFPTGKELEFLTHQHSQAIRKDYPFQR